MLDLERLDAGLIGIFQLQPGNHPTRLVAQRPHLVEFGIGAFTQETAITLQKREIVGKHRAEHGFETAGQGFQIGERRRQLVRQQSLIENGGNLLGRSQPLPDGAEIARAAALQRKTGERTRHIRNLFQRITQAITERDVIDQIGDRIEASIYFFRVGQGRHQPLGEKPRATACYRAVQGMQQRSVPFARQRLHQFQIGAGGGIDEKGRSGAFALRRTERRALGDLGFLDIGDGSGGGRHFHTRKGAEAVQR